MEIKTKSKQAPKRVKEILTSSYNELSSFITGKSQINVDVFAKPEKYVVCLPIKKVVADSKVDRAGVELYKKKIKEHEKITPIIVVKHPKKDLYAVLDGHHRYYAYYELGRKRIECSLAGDYSSVVFFLTKNGYLQPTSDFTKAIRGPAKEMHKNLKEFLEGFLERFT